MTEPLPPIPDCVTPPSIAVSVDGRIAEDKLCIDCGYNLRGLKTYGRCPECGGEVAASLRGHDLRWASLPWLRTVRDGFILMKHSTILVLVSYVGVMVVLFAWTPAVGQVALLNVVFAVIAVLLALPALSILYGFFQATRVEPRIVGQEPTWSARRLARVLPVVTLGLWGALMLFDEVGPRAPWMRQLALYMHLLLAVLATSAGVAFVQYLIALLERTAEEKVIKETKQARQIVFLALVLAGVVLVANALLPLLTDYKVVADRLRSAASTAGSCGYCVNWVFVLFALQIVWRCATIMDRTVKAAEMGADADSHKGDPPPAQPQHRQPASD